MRVLNGSQYAKWLMAAALAFGLKTADALEASDIEEQRRTGTVSGTHGELLLAQRELAEGRLSSAQTRADFILSKSAEGDHLRRAAKIWWKACRQNSQCLARFWQNSRRQKFLPLFFENHSAEHRSALEQFDTLEILSQLSASKAANCSKVFWLQELKVSGPSLYLFQDSILGCATNLDKISPVAQRLKTARAIASLTQGHSLLIKAQIHSRQTLGQHVAACRSWIQHQETQNEIDFALANGVCRSARLRTFVGQRLSEQLKSWAQQAIERPAPNSLTWLRNHMDNDAVRHAAIASLLNRGNSPQDLEARSIVLSTGVQLVDSPEGPLALRAWVPIGRDSLELWNRLPDSDWKESEKLLWMDLGLYSSSAWVARAVRFAEVLEPRPWARLVRFPKLAIGLSRSSQYQALSLTWASAVTLQAIDEPRLLETLSPILQESPFFMQMMDIYGYIRSFELSAQSNHSLPVGLDPQLRSDLEVLTRIGRAKQAHENQKLASTTSRHLKKIADSHRWTFEPLQELVKRWLETMSKS